MNLKDPTIKANELLDELTGITTLPREDVEAILQKHLGKQTENTSNKEEELNNTRTVIESWVNKDIENRSAFIVLSQNTGNENVRIIKGFLGRKSNVVKVLSSALENEEELKDIILKAFLNL